MSERRSESIEFREATKDDIPQIYDHVKAVHGEEIIPVVERIFNHKSDFVIEDNFIAYDSEKNLVASYLCLLRHTMLIDGARIPMAQMEIVGTLPEYRNRGYIRRLNQLFEKRASLYEIPLFVIAGIPYYYRELGYEYAIPMLSRLIVAKELIPKLKSGVTESAEIIPIDTHNFDLFLEARKQRNSFLNIYRDIETSDATYVLEGELGTETGLELQVLLNEEQIVGMFNIEVSWGNLQIEELWVEDVKYIPTILRYAKKKAIERELAIAIEFPSNPEIAINLERLAQSRFTQGYAWYTKIPNMKQFLELLAPALENRIDNSRFKDYTGDLRISCFKEGFVIQFEKGVVESVEHLQQIHLKDMELFVPPKVINQLVLGHFSYKELDEFYPDVTATSAKIPLVNVLFPKLNGNLRPET
ncbi:MAG: hypothetical protein BAJATHORv1_60077 [Candidatus Thorarchaeota archaeon]|nr:MAG: hypothetical protein BAJATHORv1_60077 [Candidatus Thorarchaeota archaeon]